MEKQMKNPAINAVEINDADLDEVAGGLNLGAAPVSDELSIAKQTDKIRTTSKERLDQDKTAKVNEKEIVKTEVAKTLKEVADKTTKAI